MAHDTTVTPKSKSEEAKLPTRYVAEFRKYFNGSSINAIKSKKFAMMPIPFIKYIGKKIVSKLLKADILGAVRVYKLR